MPTQPSPWFSGPLSPQQLNLSLYSYDGSGYGATGILYHSHRTILSESMTACRPVTVSSAGTWSIFQGSTTTAFSILDNSALFGLGCDAPGVFAKYHFAAAALGSSGAPGSATTSTGGIYLGVHFATGAAAGATPAQIGSGVYVQAGTAAAVFHSQGAVQAQGTGHTGQSFYINLLASGVQTNTWEPAGFYADASLTTETPPASSTDTAGFTPRQLWIWSGVAVSGTTVSTVPTPQQTWAAPITSALMNGPSGPYQALTLLNNPPALQVNQALTTSIGNNAAATVPFTARGTIDTYAAFGTATSTYTAPLNGLYLTFPTITYASNGTGARYAGLSVTSGTVTTAIQGPAYAANSAGAMSVTGVRVLDLQAGDTVKATAFQNSGGALNLGGATWNSRLGILYLCPYSSGGVNAFTPPQTAFHWMAGFPASSMPALLTQHLGNDLNFLVNRPYFTGYQATAQTGLTVGSWTAVTIDTVGGLIHASPGDSYAGWSAYNNNYAAPQPGWYLVISEVYAALPTLATGYLSAGIKVPSSGGIAPSTSPDWYQTMYFPLTSGPVPGAAAIGCYYLNAGETVQPMALAQNWTNTTWSTASAAATRSQLTILWLSELPASTRRGR
jgi:hypothetical protein